MSPSLDPSSFLTGEQQAPLVVRGASVALAAGAGCGKTTVLTQRFLGYLEGEGRLPLSSIVALTFTEKAARELRERIRKGCLDKLRAGEDRTYWRSISRSMEAARIGTFHSFCATILRRFALEAGIDPGFVVLDEAIAPTLREKSLATVVRAALADSNEDLISLAVDYGLESTVEGLGKLVAGRSKGDYSLWARTDSSEIVARWERFRDGEGRSGIIEDLLRVSQPVLKLLTQHDSTHPKMRERRQLLLSMIPRLQEIDKLSAALGQIRDNCYVKGAGTKANWETESIFEDVKKALEKYRKSLDGFTEIFSPDAGKSLAAAENGSRFARLAGLAIDAYAETKQAGGWLDFDDLQSLVLNLLRDGPKTVRENLSKSIGVLLVDEFQDTDRIQAEILQLLAGNRIASGGLFLVGDAKQSIYRFRGALPAIFAQFRGQFPAEGQLDLTGNFRSLPGVVEFVNALFESTFPGAENRLRPDPKAKPLSERPAVVFLWTDTGDDSASRRRDESERIARYLSDRLRDGWPVRDRATKRVRNATAGDIAILVRTNGDFPALEASLAAEGIDYHVVGGSSYYSQQEVIDLINLLATIEDPHDALALAGSLRSPFFALSDEAIYWLATGLTGDLPANFSRWEAIRDRFSRRDEQAVGRASRLLERWRSRKDRIAIADLIDRALDESGFEAALLGETLGERKRANVRKLVRLARRFDEMGGLTLADFVSRLRADLEDPPREEQAATTDEAGEAVRLMTIHQAKGLEFPIVVLPGLEREMTSRTNRVEFHADLGVLASPVENEDDTEGYSLGWRLYRHVENAADRAEALRLLYVATTRARDWLILSAGAPPESDAKSPALSLITSRFDRATGTLLATLPEGWPIPSIEVAGPRVGENPTSMRTRRDRPRVLAVVRSIERASPPFEPPRARRPPVSRFLRFEEMGATTPLDHSIRRVVRLAIADPALIGRESIREVVGRAFEQAGVLGRRELARAVVVIVRRWVDSGLFTTASEAKQRVFAVPWTIRWPREDGSASVATGEIDLLCRDSLNHWTVVQIETKANRPEARKLLSLLSARAAERLGYAPIQGVWPLAITQEAECETDFGDRVIEGAFREFEREVASTD